MNLDQKQLVAGDEVGVSRYGSWSNHYSVQTVKSVSKTGQVTLENGDRFTANGSLMGGSSFRPTTLIPAFVAKERIAQEAERKERNVKHAAVLYLVEKTIKEHRNGHGDFFGITVEERDAMIAAINTLTIRTNDE